MQALHWWDNNRRIHRHTSPHSFISCRIGTFYFLTSPSGEAPRNPHSPMKIPNCWTLRSELSDVLYDASASASCCWSHNKANIYLSTWSCRTEQLLGQIIMVLTPTIPKLDKVIQYFLSSYHRLHNPCDLVAYYNEDNNEDKKFITAAAMLW